MYKPGLGIATRIGVITLGVLTAIYASYSWYMHFADLTETSRMNVVSVAFIGGIVILLGLSAFTVWAALYNPKSSDYLIDTDGELRKVVWPSVHPLFDPKAEAWGSTYVVIACTIFMTVYVWAIDSVFHVAITNGLFPWLFGS